MPMTWMWFRRRSEALLPAYEAGESATVRAARPRIVVQT